MAALEENEGLEETGLEEPRLAEPGLEEPGLEEPVDHDDHAGAGVAEFRHDGGEVATVDDDADLADKAPADQPVVLPDDPAADGPGASTAAASKAR